MFVGLDAADVDRCRGAVEAVVAEAHGDLLHVVEGQTNVVVTALGLTETADR
ncbi:hypothetical protein D3C72_2600780 [compost metagenome]